VFVTSILEALSMTMESNAFEVKSIIHKPRFILVKKVAYFLKFEPGVISSCFFFHYHNVKNWYF
jgi:hypothetical protein